MTLTSKGWRSDPRVISAPITIFDRRPFGTVACIFDNEKVFVGVSRCNPVDNFDHVKGTEISTGRAQVQLATFLGLIPEERAKRLMGRTEERKRRGQPLMMMLNRAQFARIFNIDESNFPPFTDKDITPPRVKTKKTKAESPTLSIRLPKPPAASGTVRKPAKKAKKAPAKPAPARAKAKPAKPAARPVKKPAKKATKKKT